MKREKTKLKKLIVVVGPTASGKTELSIKLAKKFNGEIVSADSRQIYRGMDIGTAKPIADKKLKKKKCILVKGIPHWLIDIKNPNESFTVADFKKEAIKIIKEIQKRGKMPILTGGTGLYIKAVVENLEIPKIKPNPSLRKKIEREIEEKGLQYVFKKLTRLDPESAYIIDPKNPRRIIRALEIILTSQKPLSQQRKKGPALFSILQIGIHLSKEELKQRINRRIDKMIKRGLVREVKNLIKKFGFNQQAFEAIGYREIIGFLRKEIDLNKAIELMKKNTWKYAKRQITWFKKDKKIHWIKNYQEAKKLVEEFLRN